MVGWWNYSTAILLFANLHGTKLPNSFLITCIVLVVAALLAHWYAPRYVRSIERTGRRVASHKRAVIIGAAVFPILLRVLLLPLDPVPIPSVHDEGSYLLAADTFAHGRLTNPPHPMWIFLETFHVLQRPTYASIYPPAQGIFLAAGELLGHPWIGVLLSTATMCAAATWAMQGWLPPAWALLGSILLLFRIGVTSYWVDSYWGGAVAAAGGALVIGALPRLLKQPKIRDSILMGLGASLLANSRPVEGLLFCIPVMLALGIRIKSPSGKEMRNKALLVLVPAALVLAGTIAFMAYYNWRITGNAILFPHALYHRLYWSTPIFVWQSPGPTLAYSNPEFVRFFTEWNNAAYLTHSLTRLVITRCHDSWSFFLGLSLSVPLVTLPRLVFDRRVRLLLIQFTLCGAGALAVVWFEVHYLAPLVAPLFILVVQAIRHLRQWRRYGHPVGVLASQLVVIGALAGVALPQGMKLHAPSRSWNLRREEIAEQLKRLPSKNLVIVNYAPDHNVHHEWVYNKADIDASKIVWVRKIPERDLRPLTNYFRDRRIWLINPDDRQPHLQPYETGAQGDGR